METGTLKLKNTYRRVCSGKLKDKFDTRDEGVNVKRGIVKGKL